MNSVCLVGKLSRAPSVKFEGESTQGTTFTLAVQEPSRTGTLYTLYVPCTSWGRAAEACSLLNAEDFISVQGKRSWCPHKAKGGQEHSVLVVNVKDIAVLGAAVEVPACIMR